MSAPSRMLMQLDRKLALVFVSLPQVVSHEWARLANKVGFPEKVRTAGEGKRIDFAV